MAGCLKKGNEPSYSTKWGECLAEGSSVAVAYPGIFFSGEEGSTNSVEDRGRTELGSGSGSPIIWRQLSFGTRNFISYSKIFLIFGYFKTIYDDNQLICHC